MVSNTDSILVEVDQRRRVSLGKLGHAEHTRYLGTMEPDGTIVLRPAVVVSEAEARLLANTELVEAIRREMEHPERYVARPG